MTHIHYKFSSKLSYDTVVFDGPHITLGDLKRQIMGREKLRAADCDLRITNAQNKEEYTDDECLIPKGSSVIVRRIPIIGAKSSSSSKNRNIERQDAGPHHAFGSIKAMCDQNSSSTLPLFSKMANLADVDVSEEDKIKVMMNQSAFDSMSYNKKLPLPSNYTCYRCGNTGHHIRHCPTSGDKNFEAPPRIKKSTGIPRSFMVEVDDPNAKGAMLTNCGRYAIPSIDIKAYALGKKERPPFLPQEQPKSEDEEDPVPEELLCLICHDLLSDAVVIPCCGNSYCDDCIRTALLDSDEHVCPTCKQPDVSPDTLIANKFLRQAVDNFQKERGGAKSLRRGCGASQSQNATPTPSPVPTLPPLALPSQPQKPHLSTHQRDPLRRSSPTADTPPSAQVCVAPPTSAGPAQSAATASASLQPALSLLEIPDKEEEKTHDDSAAAVAPSVPTDAPSQLIPLVNLTPAAEQPHTVTLQQPSSAPSPRLPAPPACWDSSTDGWSESITQRLPPSVPPYPATPPPLFPSPHFHAFLSAQPPLGSYPPGYPPTGPVWPLPNLRGAPISSLCPSTAIPALIPKEWYRHQKKKKERSPQRGSSHRRSSTGSKSSKYSKSSPTRSYSHSSSRSRSRSRSRSQGRSRPSSPYSRRRDLHSRSQSSRSYSYGYKRSPTPSSSSSPRLGYQSRRKSPTDHRKASHHSRHHSKKSSSSSSSSRRRGEHHQREAGGPGGALPTYLYAQHANQSSSLELDRERYLQWSREYKEWCDKYFSSYVGHFHQAPLPLLNLPPPPPPQWGDGDGHHSHANPDSRNRQRRRSDPKDDRSPPSQSSSDSRSPPSQSSRDSRSTPSQSSSDSRSSPSPSSNSRTPLSQTSSDGRSTPSDLQEGTKGGKKNLEKLSSFKHDRKSTKERKEGRAEESSSPDAADSLDDRRKDKRTHNTGPCKDTTPAKDKTSDDSPQPLVKPDECLAKDYERKSREQRDLEMEKGRRRGKYSDSRQDAGRRNKEKPRKEADRVDSDRYPGGSAASDSRSEKSRKRKGEHSERSYSQAESSKYLKTQTAEEPRIHKSESPNLCDKKKPKTEKKKESKVWPLKKGDIWEGGISVKPQKKISININLEGKGITGKTSEKAGDGEMAAEENEREESGRNTKGVSEENTQLDGETQQKWEKATFRDDNGETFEKEEGAKKEEFDLYAALRDEEKNDGDGMEANKEEEVTPEERSAGEEAPALGETVTVTQEERTEEGNTDHPQEDLMEGVKTRKDEEEEDTMRSRSQESRNQIHHDGPNMAMDDSQRSECFCLDGQDKMAMLKSLDESTQDRAADQEDKLMLVQGPRSKWEKEESEEEELDRGATKVQTFLPSPSMSVTAESTASRETRERSVEMAAPFSVAPSSGKDRKDGALCMDRDEEKRIEKDRRRDRDRGRERQKDKRSQERLREEEKGRDRERERRNPPFVFHSHSSSSSHGSERRDRHRGSSPGPVRKSSSSGRSRESSTTSRTTKLPDQSTHKPVRDKDRHDPPGRRRDRPAGTQHKERDPPPSGGDSKVIQEAKGERDGSRWEDEADQLEGRRDLEERESPGSHSNSSSTSEENDRREKKHKKEKRQTGELLEDSELKKRKKKNGDGRQKSGREVGDRWKEEEDHNKLCSLVS